MMKENAQVEEVHATMVISRFDVSWTERLEGEFIRIYERKYAKRDGPGGFLVCCVEIWFHLFCCHKVSGKVIIIEAERNDQIQDEEVMDNNFMEI
jgi:hypothetical protein